MAGIDLPVWPERHESLVTEKIAPVIKPMLVDYTSEHGCYFQQKENGAIIGCYTPVEPVKGFDLGVSFTFLKEMSKRMIRLVPDLKDVSVVRHWSGHYTETPDGRPIIGPVKSMPSFINIAGFCGHGLMQGPRVGQLVAEQIVNGTASLDISSLALERFENPELLEKEQLH
jgi:sarcosine oxidase subunit beta